MKPIEVGQRYNFSHSKAWRKVKIRIGNFHTIYDHDQLGEDCVRAIESAEDEVML